VGKGQWATTTTPMFLPILKVHAFIDFIPFIHFIYSFYLFYIFIRFVHFIRFIHFIHSFYIFINLFCFVLFPFFVHIPLSFFILCVSLFTHDFRLMQSPVSAIGGRKQSLYLVVQRRVQWEDCHSTTLH
jgi:hypothetical protein